MFGKIVGKAKVVYGIVVVFFVIRRCRGKYFVSLNKLNIELENTADSICLV